MLFFSSTNRVVCGAVALSEDPPEWAELIPSGQAITGRDGRKFTNKTPQAIVDAFAADIADIPLDWEHSSERQAPKGMPAPAAGWITAIEARGGGSIWGKIRWTDKGAKSVQSREYRYLSPVFLHENKSNNIVALLSAGLTNQPNLHLSALNQQIHQEAFMDREKLISLLGLAAQATDEEITVALNRQKAAVDESSQKVADLTKGCDEALARVVSLTSDLEAAKAVNSRSAPSLDKYVPRADYELALNRAQEAEKKIQDQDTAAKGALVESAIAEALKARKITPATAEYHKAQCTQDGGLERFQEYVKAAPEVVAPSGLDEATPPATGDKTPLTAEQKAVCTAMEIDEEEYRKAM